HARRAGARYRLGADPAAPRRLRRVPLAVRRPRPHRLPLRPPARLPGRQFRPHPPPTHRRAPAPEQGGRDRGMGDGVTRTFVLIPGAGGAAWYWHRVIPLLREAGHEAIAVDLPGDDPRAGLPEYARLVGAAVDGRPDVVLVAQSLGGFTAPMVAAAVPGSAIVVVHAMIPGPCETPSAWWG